MMSGKLFGVVGLIVLLSATPSLAQTTGSIRGQVVDAEGVGVAGATVSVTGDLIRGQRAMISGEDGDFLFSGIPPGVFAVNAVLEGVGSGTVENVTVSISGAASLTIVLESERFEGTLEVTAERPIVDLTSSTVSTNMTAEFVEDLPTSRFMHDFINMTPGASEMGRETTSASLYVSIYGSSQSSNTYHLDGLDTTSQDQGSAWWYTNPDLISEMQVLGIGAPAEYGSMSGAAINIVTKSGTNEHKGRLSWYWQGPDLVGTNVKLEGLDGEVYGHNRVEYHNITLTAGGPLKKDKLWYFGGIEYNSDTMALPGTDPDFAGPFDWWRYDLKLTAALSKSTTLELKGHREDYDWFFEGSQFATPSNWYREPGDVTSWGALLQSVLSDRTFLEAHYTGWFSNDFGRSQTGSTDPWYTDYTQPVPVTTGSIWYPYDYEVGRDQADVKLSYYTDEFIAGDHEFRFGVTYSQGTAETLAVPCFGDVCGWKYQYYYYPYYYTYTRLPFLYGSENETLSAFVDDSWRINDKLTVNVGVRYDKNDGRIPAYPVLDNDANPTGEMNPAVDNVIDWQTYSPRIGFAYQVAEGKGVLRGSYGKYYDGNVTGNWNDTPPGMPIAYYSWGYYPDGPFYVYKTIDPSELGPVDPNLRPPETDQYALGYQHQVGSDMALGVQLVHKKTKNNIGFEILGDGVYEVFPYTDPVTGDVYELASIIEKPTYRKGNRPGVGSLAPPGADYWQEYDGFFLTFQKRYSRGWSMQASYGYSESKGRATRMFSQYQGRVFWGALEGTDPNHHVNGEGLQQGDRKHIFQAQGNFNLPWKLDASTMIRWMSGRAHSRLATVVDLNQGTTTVTMDAANDSLRLPSRFLLDFTLGRSFPLGAGTALRFDVQVFNILNEDAWDWWEEDAYERGQFVPEIYALPRRVMLRLAFDF
jgi:outer membrane receptor protein involved in Fe transport